MSIGSILGASIQPIPPAVGGQSTGELRSGGAGSAAAPDFGQTLAGALDSVNADLQVADDEVNALVRGESVELHRAMMSLEKADVSVRLMSQVGRRVVDAYREIIRMGV